VANWPDRRSHAWRSLLLARAIENQAYVIGVNRVNADGNGIIHSGDSAMIDPMGKYINTASPFKDEMIQGVITQSALHDVRQRLPFFDDRDEFLIKPEGIN
jgi:predicted amidohydrolase